VLLGTFGCFGLSLIRTRVHGVQKRTVGLACEIMTSYYF
jgi:hypothetical protein